MFEYKNADFYNAYCEQLEDFMLLEYFVDIDNKYVGKILAKDAIYKLELIVKIPKTFPHNKLYFYTSSLYGYPHLIPCGGGESWFCLNSAFVETTRGQLDEEFDRLRGWIKEQMRPELPAIIADIETTRALTVFNTYSKGNDDEMEELHRTNEELIFVGDFAQNVNCIEKTGCFDCVKQRNGKYVAFDSPKGGNAKLPFVIVDHNPKNCQSFAALSAEFGWDEELCETLLPGFYWGQIESEGHFMYESFEHLTLEKMEEDRKFLSEQLEKGDFPESYKCIMKQKVDSFIQSYSNCFIKGCSDYEALGGDPEHDMNKYLYSRHSFALGVISDGRIEWNLLSAQHVSDAFEFKSFDFGKLRYESKRIVEISLMKSKTKNIRYDDFFGRGCLDSHLSEKRILLIGVGAIGSFLAETLVRGGIRNITLADGDFVEAGNLCRASYEIEAIGNSKAEALREKLKRISSFCSVKTLGNWYENGMFECDYKNGELYGNINYDGQEKFLKELNQYDLILDCTASNELLHFLSYAVKKTVPLISICITNHAQDCFLMSNANGNVFEQRKHFLAQIEQDTDNFYTEGTGCYAPTFLATASDMLPFTNMVVRKINKSLASSIPIISTIWSYKDDSIVADVLCTYKIENGAIRLVVSQNVIEEIRNDDVFDDGEIGILMGGYSFDGTLIFVTNLVSLSQVPEAMIKVQESSEGILDYVGNACLSGMQNKYEPILRKVAHDEAMNTNNPLLAQLNKNGNVDFSLMVGDELVPFVLQNNQ